MNKLLVIDDDFVRSLYRMPTGRLVTVRLDDVWPDLHAENRKAILCKCVENSKTMATTKNAATGEVLSHGHVVHIMVDLMPVDLLLTDLTRAHVAIGQCPICLTVYWTNIRIPDKWLTTGYVPFTKS